MQIKSFSARSGKEVLARIKEELGPDAVILDSREEDGMITMTAATERDPVRDTRDTGDARAVRGGRADWTRAADGRENDYDDEPAPASEAQASLPLPGFEPIGGRPMRYQPFPQTTLPPRPLSALAAKDMPLVPAEQTDAGADIGADIRALAGASARTATRAAQGAVVAADEKAAATAPLRPMRAEDAAAEAFRAAQARTRARQKPINVPTLDELRAASGLSGGLSGGQSGALSGAPIRPPHRPVQPGPGAGTVFRESGQDPAPERTAPRRSAPAGEAAHGQAHHQANNQPPPGWQQWHEEWSSLKNQIMALMKPALRLDELPPRQRLAIEFLQREGVGDDAVLRLYQRLQQDPTASILTPLSRLVPVRTWSTEYWPQRIQVITGPFGAGKTSVSIRMALSLRKSAPGCRICLVNADATRGNGRLLLRHYCDLSDMAYKEASTTLDLVAALNTALREGFDRILVDLPGLSRGRYLATLLADAGLGEHTGESPDDLAVHLALPPHYGSVQLRGLLKRYSSPHAGSIVWTKLDEAEHYGQLVNVAVESGLPVSALSFGPGLGNSLAPAKENMLWRLLFKRELPLGA